MANDKPKREKPVSGFFVKRMDVKAWVAIIGMLLAGGAVVFSLLGGFFESKEAAGDHKQEFQEHKSDFATHSAVNEERHKIQERQNVKIDAMNENIIKLGERLHIGRKLRRVEEEDHD